MKQLNNVLNSLDNLNELQISCTSIDINEQQLLFTHILGNTTIPSIKFIHSWSLGTDEGDVVLDSTVHISKYINKLLLNGPQYVLYTDIQLPDPLSELNITNVRCKRLLNNISISDEIQQFVMNNSHCKINGTDMHMIDSDDIDSNDSESDESYDTDVSDIQLVIQLHR